MAQDRSSRSNAARKEREDWNEALEELCDLRSQVSSTATVWHLPNRYPPAGRNRLCGRAVTDAASVAVNECSRWRLAFRPVRSFRSHFGCADGSGVLSLCRILADVLNPEAPIGGFSLMGVLTAGRRPSRVSCAFDRLPRLVNRLKSPRMLLRADGIFAAPGGVG